MDKKRLAIAIGVAPPKDDMGPDDDLHMAASDLIAAVHDKDVAGVMAAMRAGFQCMEMEPHDEGEHESEGETPEEPMMGPMGGK